MPERRTFRETVQALKASSKPLRGSVKLSAALDAFAIDAKDALCLDVGASTGGFTTALLERGAKRVYAVDAGHGQLLGSLRQDPRVVNLEATNVAALDAEIVPDEIDIVTIDVSYLALRDAVAQLAGVRFARGAHMIGLVKPMFELRMSSAPTDRAALDHALARAVEGITDARWTVQKTMDSPVTGAGGARELFVHAQR